MRSFPDEYKSGTFEILKTLPLTEAKIVWGKFLGCMLIVMTALLPTIVYAISIQCLSNNNGIDIAATSGSYIGLVFLSSIYCAVGICVGSYTNNTVVAFITSAFACFILYSGFDGISKLPYIKGTYDYFVEMLDIGCGGGFPGIPLAIFFPETQFLLVDSIGKKLKVVNEICAATGITNITTQHTRVEEVKNRKFDFAISRAVAPLKDLWFWSKPLLNAAVKTNVPNGLICLKGGDLHQEISE
ncbi:unnamed protein product, partial [Rotaria sp. Silwood1]